MHPTARTLILLVLLTAFPASAEEPPNDGVIYRTNATVVLKTGERISCLSLLWLMGESDSLRCDSRTDSREIALDLVDIEETFGHGIASRYRTPGARAPQGQEEESRAALPSRQTGESPVPHDRSDASEKGLESPPEDAAERVSRLVQSLSSNRASDILDSASGIARLARMRVPEAIEALDRLIPLLGDNRKIRISSYRLGSTAAPLRSEGYLGAHICRAIGDVGEPARPPLITAALHHTNPVVRARACLALGRVGGDGATQTVIGVLRNDPEAEARQGAATALGRLGGPGAYRALMSGLSDQDVSVRVAAVRSFAVIGDRSAVPDLIRMLEDPDTGVRDEAVEALAELQDPRSVPALIERLRDNAGNVRARTARVLGEMGDDRAVEPLVRALREDSYAAVRSNAATSLRKLGASEATDSLLGSLKDSDAMTRQHAASSLEDLAGEESLPELERLLRSKDPEVRKRVLGILKKMDTPRRFPVIIDFLNRGGASPDERRAALTELAESPSPEAHNLLAEFLTGGRDETVQRAAAISLAIRGEREDIEALISALSHPTARDPAKWALKDISHRDFGYDEGAWREWASSR